MRRSIFFLVALSGIFAHPTISNFGPTCASSKCINVHDPCMDDNNGKCLPRTDPTYNVTSGQCRAGTTDCCCTSKCCCPPSLPCQQQNDYKCMPKIAQNGSYCKFDDKTGSYPASCVCSAGTQTCHEDPRKCSTPVCQQPLDILFLVDSSGSIGDSNYRAMGQGMSTIVKDGLTVGPNKVNVAAWTFSTCGEKHKGFGFKQYMTDADVESHISRLPYDHGRTCTGEAIDWTLSAQWPSARPNVSHAMVIVTDGKPQDDVSKPSQKARAAGIKMFAIGVGGTYNEQSLKEMASQPYSDYVYTLKDFDLKKVAQKLIGIACNTTATATDDTEFRPIVPPADIGAESTTGLIPIHLI